MDHSTRRYNVFVLLKTTPAWLAMSRSHRDGLSAAIMETALTGTDVRVSHFDAEAFSGRCTDVAQFEASDLRTFYGVMERLRDSALFSVPYFEVVDIIPSIRNGYREIDVV
ncbi:hypothetical protein DID96_13860 [Burkholderia sp. Bp8963]|uniref:darcynin family protein n=1 Tax=Burkholderia sp. Bp8963 TaxID=2184547 RepID=UPI000F591221|nr:darcynin family protein [Burkholderia sp. Bp8963]RQS71261.1 hypothetical protein DID96_13860 [Burkholderia sp. Bp8963]